MKTPCIALLSLFAVAGTTRADLVTIEFEAEAATIVGQPFGIEVPRLTVVRGLFTYDTDTPDLSPGDVNRGNFDLSSNWKFRAEFLGHVITGSTVATANTNLFGHSMGFKDGGDRDDTGDMTFDDVTASDIDLTFGISGDAEDLPDDQLPDVFRFRRSPPFNFAPHTFSLRDDSGTMLLQFVIIKQHPIVPIFTSITASTTEATLKWCSQYEQDYAIEFSTNLINWQVIYPSVIGELIDTSLVDVFADRLGNGAQRPPDGYYRIREVDPGG